MNSTQPFVLVRGLCHSLHSNFDWTTGIRTATPPVSDTMQVSIYFSIPKMNVNLSANPDFINGWDAGVLQNAVNKCNCNEYGDVSFNLCCL